jgi:hypothetical protein
MMQSIRKAPTHAGRYGVAGFRLTGLLAIAIAAAILAAALPGGAQAQLNLSTPGASDYGPLPPPGAADQRTARPEPRPLEGPPIGGTPGGEAEAADDGGFSFTIEGGGSGTAGAVREDPTAAPGQVDLFDPDARDRIRCQDARWRSLNPSVCGTGTNFELQWRSQ